MLGVDSTSMEYSSTPAFKGAAGSKVMLVILGAVMSSETVIELTAIQPP